jgi:hypothetical protein
MKDVIFSAYSYIVGSNSRMSKGEFEKRKCLEISIDEETINDLDFDMLFSSYSYLIDGPVS